MDMFLYEEVEEKHKDDISKVMRHLWLLWVLGFSSMPVIFVVIVALGGRLQEQIVGSADTLRILIPVFSVVAIGSQVAAFILRKVFLSGKMNKYILQNQKRVASNDPDFVVLCRGGLFLPAAMSSMPTFLGFVLFILGAPTWLFYVFITVAVLGMLYHRPQKDLIVEFIINGQADGGADNEN